MKHLILETLGGLVLAAAGLVGYALWDSGTWGLVDIPPSHVAVRVNHAAGTAAVIAGPGYAFHLPFSQEVELLNRRPQTFRMEGDVDQARGHQRFLTVRAADGSNFWFESMELSYRLLPAAADRVLADSGPDDAFRDWVGAYARGVLCDEFGRYEAQDIANLNESQNAKEEARRRLNELLEPHGVVVDQITTPKPKFDRDYEKAIYDRKIANQEVEKLGLQVDQLREERAQRLAKVDKEKKIELEALNGTLEEFRLQAESKVILLRGQADVYATERRIAAESLRAELLARAEAVRDKAGKEAEGLAAMVAAVAAGGDAAVRMAYVERLKGMRFRMSTPEQVAAPAAVAQAGKP
jgi:regulator of protease activity HflC (stomatin/prohibitin superfamily)